MQTFAYQVRDQKGKKIKGVTEASSEKILADRFAQEGFLVSYIKPARRFALPQEFPFLTSRISSDDLIMLYFQIGNMLEAGVPLLAALRSMADQVENRAFKKMIRAVAASIEGGESLSEAMGRHPKNFPVLARRMIQVGETSGNLAQVMRYVGELDEARADLQFKIRSALAYPAVLAVASVAVVILMIVWVIPSFAAIFTK